jgi:2-polyprenyl-6-methoxyphenol hydroxylase and related FAD-dependent oxidoreductases
MKREEDTGISILVVGGGIAGLSFAIEAHRKGHNVRVIERRRREETFGKHRTEESWQWSSSHRTGTPKIERMADHATHGFLMQAK